MEHSEELKKFIHEKSSLFWYIPEDKKENIDLGALAEFILNYGNETEVKKIFSIIGMKNVAEIFKKQISATKHNYFPSVAHYFSLYFKKYAH